MNNQADITKDWQLYQAGIKYNQALYGSDKDYYDVIDTNIAFASGDQWRNVKGEGLPKPVFNIIKRVKQFKVASLKSSNIAISIQPMEYRADDTDEKMQERIHITDLANAEVKNIFENINFDSLTRTLLNDGFDTGDFCLHFYFDTNKFPYKQTKPEIKGMLEAEVIDCTNVLFGNPNTRIVEKQPYIIIVGRDFVRNLEEEHKKENKKKEKISEITEDNDTQYQAGDFGKIEIEADDYGKALYIIKYYRGKDGKIYANKSVQNTYIYQNKKTDYDYYPIAFGNWETVKGSYHGSAEATGIIPNQIAINKMFAMVIYHLMLTAFPTAVYNADKVDQWSNEIGSAIPLTNLQVNESIRNVAGYLEPAQMSGQIMNAIELAMQYTKETLGVGDASLGNVTMNNASAIIAIQKSNAVPLENVRANLYEFVEDCGRIILDMIATNYGIRPVVVTDGENRTVEEFDFAKLKGMWLHIKADVGTASYFSEIASLQTLDNLLNAGRIEFIEYLKRIPDEIIPKKQELIQSLESQDIYHQALFNLMDQFLQGLPPEIQQQLQSMDPKQMEQEILKMMGALGSEQPTSSMEPVGTPMETVGQMPEMDTVPIRVKGEDIGEQSTDL